MEELLRGRSEELFLCGHDHMPNLIQLSSGKLIVNPGSVGLQAYEDDKPLHHVVENGNPQAKYCVISQEDTGWSVKHVSLPYDHISAGETAKRNHRADWHLWLKTGFVR